MEIVPLPDLTRDYSSLGEQAVIQDYLKRLPGESRFFVDIGASWGLELSNTVSLAQQGWAGLAAEYDPDKFARLARNWKDFDVALHRGRVTPDTVVAVLEAAEAPKEFGFLSLDIDSYDAFVLTRLLQEFRPRLICAEVNETIPPPVKFSVCFSDAPLWQGGNFMGASVSYMAEVAHQAGYVLLRQHYNNAFFAPQECGLPGVSPELAYTAGYRDQPDRDAKFPYNAWMSELWGMEPAALLASVQERFDSQATPFHLSL